MTFGTDQNYDINFRALEDGIEKIENHKLDYTRETKVAQDFCAVRIKLCFWSIVNLTRLKCSQVKVVLFVFLHPTNQTYYLS